MSDPWEYETDAEAAKASGFDAFEDIIRKVNEAGRRKREQRAKQEDVYGEDAEAHKPIKATPFDPDKWKTIPRRKWLYGGHYIRGYVTGTSAPTTAGKSTVTLAEDVSMMTGLDLLKVGPSRMPPRRLKVWVWNGEDPEEEIVRRLKAICLRHGTPETEGDFEETVPGFDFSFEDLRGFLYLDSGRDLKIKVAKMAAGSIVVDQSVIREMMATIKGEGIDVVSLDPLKSTHRVSENSEAMDDVIEAFKDIADECDCSIEHVHHTRKGPRAAHEVTSDDSRGSTSIMAAWRDGRVVNVMDAATATACGIDNRFRFIKLESDRPNMTVRGDNEKWFYLASASLENGDAEGPPDSVGVVVPWSLPSKSAEAKASDATRILEALCKLIDAKKRITRERGGDYTVAKLVPYLKRQDPPIKATVDEIRDVLETACEGRDGKAATLEYIDDAKRGKAGYAKL